MAGVRQLRTAPPGTLSAAYALAGGRRVGRHAVGEVDQLREHDRPRPGAPPEREVLVELAGKGPQDRVDHEPLLDREVTAVAVGHPVEPVTDRVDVAARRRPRLDARQPLGDLGAPELARRTLAARLVG